jgi:hypothetical protein
MMRLGVAQIDTVVRHGRELTASGTLGETHCCAVHRHSVSSVHLFAHLAPHTLDNFSFIRMKETMSKYLPVSENDIDFSEPFLEEKLPLEEPRTRQNLPRWHIPSVQKIVNVVFVLYMVLSIPVVFSTIRTHTKKPSCQYSPFPMKRRGQQFNKKVQHQLRHSSHTSVNLCMKNMKHSSSRAL